MSSSQAVRIAAAELYRELPDSETILSIEQLKRELPTDKPFGVIRGLCVVVGDEVRYINRHGQGMNGIVKAIYVESRGLIRVKRAEWPSDEVIDLSDAYEYPRISFHGR